MLANLKIRKKLLVALLPLGLMVLAATLYSSIEMVRIDSWYTDLIDRDVQALAKPDRSARAEPTGLASTSIRRSLSPTWTDRDHRRPRSTRASRPISRLLAAGREQESPALAPQIARPPALIFDQAVADARSIRDSGHEEQLGCRNAGDAGSVDADCSGSRRL